MKSKLAISFTFLSILVFSQTPAIYPHWQLKWGDEFNGSSINTTNWRVSNNSGISNQPWSVHIDSEVIVSGGNLELGVHQQSYSCPPFYVNADPWNCVNQYNTQQPYRYTSGEVNSEIIRNQRFGYIEAKIKIPYKSGIWPAFWTFKGIGVTGTNCAEEIDIFEMIAINSSEENLINSPVMTTTNVHDFYDVNIPGPAGTVHVDAANGASLVPGNGFTYENWHTYGIEWDPVKIIWYIDNKVARIVTNHNVLDSSRIILGHGVKGEPAIGMTTSPMLVDYVRVYELKKDCNTILDVCNYNFSTHDNRLKANIKIGNGSCANTLNVGDNVHLRSKEGVLIKGEFTVPLGAQLYLSGNPCN